MTTCDLCKGTGEFDLSAGGHPGVVEECAACGGAGVKQPRRRRWAFKGVVIRAIDFQLVHRDDARLAPLDVLRRRAYMRVYVLPFRRLLLVSWLDL